MLRNLSSWNYNLIYSLFNPRDAAAILSTPLYSKCLVIKLIVTHLFGFKRRISNFLVYINRVVSLNYTHINHLVSKLVNSKTKLMDKNIVYGYFS